MLYFQSQSSVFTQYYAYTQVLASYSHDGNNVQETDANGYTQQFIRGEDEEMLTYIDSDGNSYHTEYDDSGLITGFVYPDGGRLRVNYDPDGLVTSVVNPSGETVSFTYDSNDRVVSV